MIEEILGIIRVDLLMIYTGIWKPGGPGPGPDPYNNLDEYWVPHPGIMISQGYPRDMNT